MVDFVRAHGNQPGPAHRPALTGALAGIPAGLAFLAVMWPMGTPRWVMEVANLRSYTWAAALHMAVSAIVGAVYGLVLQRAAEDRGGSWLFGLAYGFLVWLVGPIAILQLLARMPPPHVPAALALIGGHLLYGLVLGLAYPLVHALLRPTSRWMQREAPG
ncbi:MAG: hypothetical protein HY320_00920 [Armatimonadetes bacterium]|nr:hypothetical protein [Armatimonadota bacterium]